MSLGGNICSEKSLDRLFRYVLVVFAAAPSSAASSGRGGSSSSGCGCCCCCLGTHLRRVGCGGTRLQLRSDVHQAITFQFAIGLNGKMLQLLMLQLLFRRGRYTLTMQLSHAHYTILIIVALVWLLCRSCRGS